jgi:hypothetical protein
VGREHAFAQGQQPTGEGRYVGGMTEDPGHGPPAERLLDLLFYAPVGVALSVVEAMPDLVRKGRERLGPQVGVARTVGQFAVRQGYRQLLGYATSRGAFPFRAAEPARTYTSYPAEVPGHDGPADVDGHAMRALPAEPVAPMRRAAPTGEVGTGLAAADLAIPSYDSLSATQVVERLAGLSQDEIRAVAAYEAATRRRKTVLTRAEQLLKK